MKKIVIDLDETICRTVGGDYSNSVPVMHVIDRLCEYKKMGFEISIFTARNMRTYQGNHGKIIANTVPLIVKWLDDNNVPYDEIHIGKPWCGTDGFYVDDKAIRPDEFVKYTYDEIRSKLKIGS